MLLIGPLRPVLAQGLADFTVHKLGVPVTDRVVRRLRRGMRRLGWRGDERWSPSVRALAAIGLDEQSAVLASAHAGAMAVSASMRPIDDALLAALPELRIISTCGVGYDHIDVNAAARRGIIVTYTPDVLTEETADTAIGLLLNTVRELPQAERYLRAGKWPQGDFRLSRATLRNRTVGMVGLGRVGSAIARRLEAFGVPVVYHTRHPRPELYRHYPRLLDMARDVDTLIVTVPGGAPTKYMIDASVLAALGPEGILINVGRGSVIVEPALIRALREGKSWLPD